MTSAQQPHTVREVHYRIGSTALGHPGRHRSRSGHSGFEFRAHAALQDAPDVRRLDLHASLRDPFETWQVRLYNERKAVPVVVVADVSASMGFEGPVRKLGVLADLTQSLAQSAWRSGDSFGFIACDEQVRADLALPATRRRGAGVALAQTLRALQASGRSAQALAQAHRHLTRQRTLVFLVSDFHFPLADVHAVLASLAAHDVLPVVLWQPAEFALSPAHGLAQVQEPESGARQWLWWRPALRERWLAAHAAQRAALAQAFRAHRLAPLFMPGAFDADAVTRHFLA
jgi:Mg-chelatase subunit ChlD